MGKTVKNDAGRNLRETNKSPFENPTDGKFTQPDLSIEHIKTVQNGMLAAFDAGKKSEGKNPAREYISYACILLSYIAAGLILWNPDNRFNAEIQQSAVGYLISFPASILGISIGKG